MTTKAAEPCDFTDCGYCPECRDPSKTPEACPTCPDPRCADYELCLKKQQPVTFFMCGGEGCPKGGKHVWDGEAEGEYEGGARWSSVACSKCDLPKMNYDLMRAP